MVRGRILGIGLVLAIAAGSACTGGGVERTVVPAGGAVGDIGEAGSQPPAVLSDGDLGDLDPVDTAPIASVGADEPPDLSRLVLDSRVFMVGDSVMNAMEIGEPDAIDTYISSLGWDVTVDAVDGRFIAQGLRVLRERREMAHDVVVLMLGNNYDGDEVAFRRHVLEILELLSGVKRIIMFTVPLYKPNRQEVNDALIQIAIDEERLELINWQAVAEQGDDVLGGDKLHPTTPYGADVLAQLIGRRLGVAPFAPPGVTLPEVGRRERP